MNHAGAVWSVAWWINGLRLATGCSDNSARIWDAVTGEEILQLRHRHKGQEEGGVASVAWSPDGRHLATSSYDGFARIFDAETGHEKLKMGNGSFVTSIAWRPDSRVL